MALAPRSDPGPVLADLTRGVDAALEAVIGRDRPVALVNFPNHGNPGDPAIWLGTRAALRRLGCRVAYASSWSSFDRRALDAALPDGPVLVNGGGNLGDLYAGQQGLRERLLVELRGRRLVQLPQSIHFRDRENLDRVRRLVAEHGDVVLMVREQRSQDLALDHFEAQVVLSPDHSLGLGALRRSGPPEVDALWLHRQPGDPEHVEHGAVPAGLDVREVEWLHTVAQDQAAWDAVGRRVLDLNTRLGARASTSPVWARRAWRPLAATFTPLAERWVQRGLDVLGQGRVVVTDKLHGHLLCVLTGTPHVVLDNSYGKVSATWQTWTSAVPGARWADDAATAAQLATALLEEAPCGWS